jgi:hypothetical protein
MIKTYLYRIFKWTLAAFACAIAGFFVFSISSCGKGNEASPEGLDIEYEVLNLSPDVLPVDLFINFAQVNTSPFIYGVNQGYFYVPSLVLPFQIRDDRFTGTTIDTVLTPLASGAKYSLFIIGSVSDNNPPHHLVTVDTATLPALGQGKLRFINLSPTASGGLDMYANGTKVYSSSTGYRGISPWQPLPVGNYDIQIDATGTTTILNEMSSVTIQDGRLYTIYAYGYNSRADTAAFTAGIITNR